MLEDAWREPPENAYEWTVAPHEAPDEPRYVEVQFRQGVPIALDGAEMEPVALVETLSKIGGEHGVGRIDHIEDRLVGIKSREIYEAPAATILIRAHKALEGMVHTKDQVRFGDVVSREYASSSTTASGSASCAKTCNPTSIAANEPSPAQSVSSSTRATRWSSAAKANRPLPTPTGHLRRRRYL